MPEITFSSSDLEGVIPGHDDPMIISVGMVNVEVKMVFVDQGSSADIIFRDVFDKLKLNNSDLQTYKEELIGFFLGESSSGRVCNPPFDIRKPTTYPNS